MVKINLQKLKTASLQELYNELYRADDEMHDNTSPVSWARYNELENYYKEIHAEIQNRKTQTKENKSK